MREIYTTNIDVLFTEFYIIPRLWNSKSSPRTGAVPCVIRFFRPFKTLGISFLIWSLGFSLLQTSCTVFSAQHGEHGSPGTQLLWRQHNQVACILAVALWLNKLYGPGARLLECESQRYHLLPIWLWKSYLNSAYLDFRIRKIRAIMLIPIW